MIDRNWVQNQIDTRQGKALVDFVGRALIVLFENQTATEKSVNSTSVDNGVGFTGADGRTGCLTAKYYLKHRNLQDWQINAWIRKSSTGFSRLAKYHAQLNAAANAKMAARG